ncbi:Protein of unknown function DUF166 [Methanosalsum zhilinae DSM 4017]|uniref:Thymidylate synthase n=1 Tax=Methanosalsum zhilinae (strain DSM 4017 / NBRC 107636 / OCM 62 / WeN5) TaxID=679901 RepID=F7XPC6_METZD|nr:DUF166 domain-containing protein [Methanosalsum zhilinae]AEH60253.1 Protein of unknown function DUF166 [Methanosalsum zhilinae DSM 4017]
MTVIGIITRGKYGKRLVKTLRSKTDLKSIVAQLPENAPQLIDEPLQFLEKAGFDYEVFDADIIITYSLHPDLTSAIANLAAKNGVKALIIPGGRSQAPVQELQKISRESGIYIENDEICCTLKENAFTSDFTSKLGTPELKISICEDKVSRVQVIRGAPCGSTWYMADKLKGVNVKEAPSMAGLLVQQYPCRAVRGTHGGIHESAEVHKRAVEMALLDECNLQKDFQENVNNE